jgi:hypothetical protein
LCKQGGGAVDSADLTFATSKTNAYLRTKEDLASLQSDVNRVKTMRAVDELEFLQSEVFIEIIIMGIIISIMLVCS